MNPEPEYDNGLTVFDVIMVVGIGAFCIAFVWWAYEGSVLWGALQ